MWRDKERNCKIELRTGKGDPKVLPCTRLRAPQLLVNTSSTPTIASYLCISNFKLFFLCTARCSHGNLLARQNSHASQNGQPSSPSLGAATAVVPHGALSTMDRGPLSAGGSFLTCLALGLCSPECSWTSLSIFECIFTESLRCPATQQCWPETQQWRRQAAPVLRDY